MAKRGRKLKVPDTSEIDVEEAKEKDDSLAQQVKRKLQHGYIQDLKKPEIDHFERAAIIAEVLEEEGWSQREMAKKFGISHSTLQDWLLWNRIEEEEYRELLDEGMTHTQIYRELRDLKDGSTATRTDSKSNSDDGGESVSDLLPVDRDLKEWERRTRSWMNEEYDFSEETEEHVNGLIATLNDFKDWMEREKEYEEDEETHLDDDEETDGPE